MEIKNILADLQGLDDGGVEKTASASNDGHAVKTSTARDKLVSALDNVLSGGGEKTAAASAPATGELVKMASSLANSEGDALVKEAHVYGAAVADGFMARLGQYEQATQGMSTTKVASANGVPTEAEFEKFAQENPDLTKQAMELGYLHGKQQIEELKKLAFDQGYQDAEAEINELAKTAAGREKLAAISQELTKQAGYQPQNELEAAFNKLAETHEGQEKLAAIRQGYADGMAEIEKTANDCFERGYNDTIRILQAL